MGPTKSEATREVILDHALAAASEVGFEGLSLGDLAKRVGMSKSGLFAHFASKQELELAVLQQAARHFVGTVVAPGLRAPRGEPRVRALFENWFRWSSDSALPGGCLFINAATELDDAEFAVMRGEKAKRQLIDWSKRSLHTNPDVAKSLYQDWSRSQLANGAWSMKWCRSMN